MLDSTIVALALPSIQHDIGASTSGLQWVMNGYLLVIAALVVTGGGSGTSSAAGRCSPPAADLRCHDLVPVRIAISCGHEVVPQGRSQRR